MESALLVFTPFAAGVLCLATNSRPWCGTPLSLSPPERPTDPEDIRSRHPLRGLCGVKCRRGLGREAGRLSRSDCAVPPQPISVAGRRETGAASLIQTSQPETPQAADEIRTGLTDTKGWTRGPEARLPTRHAAGPRADSFRPSNRNQRAGSTGCQPPPTTSGLYVAPASDRACGSCQGGTGTRGTR